jgi:hypothetical protein
MFTLFHGYSESTMEINDFNCSICRLISMVFDQTILHWDNYDILNPLRYRDLIYGRPLGSKFDLVQIAEVDY